jgi:hypothetical protein
MRELRVGDAFGQKFSVQEFLDFAKGEVSDKSTNSSM